MFEYFVILILLLFGVFHYDIRNQVFNKKLFAVIIFILMTLLTGLRYRVGGDALMYEDYFPWQPNLSEFYNFVVNENYFDHQPLFVLFVAVCKSINPDYYFYQFVHAVVTNSIITWFLYKYCKKFFTAMLLFYILGLYFYFTFEIQREILAICCFLLGFGFYLRNRWFAYYLLAIIAFFFHISAFVLFLLPFMKLIRFNQTIVIIILISSFFLSFFKSAFFSIISIFLVTDAMADKANIYSEMDFSILGLLFFFVGRVGFLLPIVFYYTKHKNEELRIFVLIFFIFSCLSQVLVGFERMMNYVTIPFIICFCNFIYSENVFKFKFKKKVVFASTYICLFFIICIKVVLDLNVTDRARYQAVFFPYSSVFEKNINLERERFMIELWKR